MTRTQVDRSELVASPDVLPRMVSSGPVVKSYAAIIRMGPGDGSAMGYPVVFDDGETKWIADGFKRLCGMDIVGIARPLVDLRKGTKADATWFASGANREHGQPMSNEAKRRAVDNLLACEAAANLNAHQIAAQVGVAHTFVLARQARLEKAHGKPSEVATPGRPPSGTIVVTDDANGTSDAAVLNTAVKPGKRGKEGKSTRFAPKRRLVTKGFRAKPKRGESEPPKLLDPIERRADLVAGLTGLLNEIGDWVDRVLRTQALSAGEMEALGRGLDALRKPVRDALHRAEDDLERFTKAQPGKEKDF